MEETHSKVLRLISNLHRENHIDDMTRKWLSQTLNPRADKGWTVKRARPSKKVWCSGLGLCLEMSPVFDFGQSLRCGLSFRHCRCHWIMAAWELSCFLTLFFLVPLCLYAVSKRQILLIFCGRFSWSKQTSCYYSSAVVRSFQYLWSAVVTILLRTRASCRHVLVYHMCDLGSQSM